MDIREIRYINLKKDIGKRLLMELLLAGSGYPKRRIDGVVCRGADTGHEGFDAGELEDYIEEESVNRQNGVKGCWLAHTRAIEDAISGEGLTVVLEDDFACKRQFFETALGMINTFDREFDVVFFDPSGTGPKRDHFLDPGIFNPKGDSYPYYFGSHCLFYNNRSIPKILEIKKQSKIRDYDGFLLHHTDIKSYVFYTGQSGAISLGSSISGIRSSKAFLRGMANRLRFMLTKA